MKKLISFMLALACVLGLTGCGDGIYPEKAIDGAEWDETWAILGTVLGVGDVSFLGLSLDENPVVLAGDDTYYATWTYGAATEYINDEGEETDLYDAQIYLLLYGCEDEAAAQQAVSDWMEREEQVYSITDEQLWTSHAAEETGRDDTGQDYTVLTYDTASDSNPYSHGMVAFGVFQNYAVSVELTCTDQFDRDAEDVLWDFLLQTHYSADYHLTPESK